MSLINVIFHVFFVLSPWVFSVFIPNSKQSLIIRVCVCVCVCIDTHTDYASFLWYVRQQKD